MHAHTTLGRMIEPTQPVDVWLIFKADVPPLPTIELSSTSISLGGQAAQHPHVGWITRPRCMMRCSLAPCSIQMDLCCVLMQTWPVVLLLPAQLLGCRASKLPWRKTAVQTPPQHAAVVHCPPLRFDGHTALSCSLCTATAAHNQCPTAQCTCQLTGAP